MIFGQTEHTKNQQLWAIHYFFPHQKTKTCFRPGKYLALDCEMVGVGLDGVESSLARVSIVNYYGAVLLDEFVRQKERVVDYRTKYSGVRESDMIKGTSTFNESINVTGYLSMVISYPWLLFLSKQDRSKRYRSEWQIY